MASITSDGNSPLGEPILVPYDEVMPSHKAVRGQFDSVGLQAKFPPPPPTVNELLCFVQNKVEVLPKDNLAQLCPNFDTKPLALQDSFYSEW